MLLKESISKKSRNLFHKTLHNFKSIFFGGYQKLPKSLRFNPFISCAKCNFRKHKTDKFYTDFYDELESATHLHNMKESIKEDHESPSEGSFMKFGNKQQSPVKIKQRKEVLKEKKKMGSSDFGRAKMSTCSSEKLNRSQNHVSTKKMKELEMMDGGDLEQVLDIEEAIHYYSRLKSPAYVDIVDNFFMDIYSEFSNPSAASASTNNSKRRFGSFRS